MKEEKKLTIKDMADLLGVSTATISRALADKWDVNPQTRERILNAAEKYDFHPNPYAQNLKKRRSYAIGIAVPEFVNSFFSRVIMGAQDFLNKEGFNLLITQSNESRETELSNLKLMRDNMVEGIIISVTHDGANTEFYRKLIDNGIPLVFFNRVCKEIETPCIEVNDREMACEVTRHLIAQGCCKIAHLSGPDNLSLTITRIAGYKDALSEAGIGFDPDLVVRAGVVQEKGYEAARQLLDSGIEFDGIFAFNDPSALGAMQLLKEHNIRIPEDVALAGFSESRSALLVEPKLTSVEQPTYEMGELAASMIVEQIKIKQSNTKRKLPVETVMKARLNVRASSLRKD